LFGRFYCLRFNCKKLSKGDVDTRVFKMSSESMAISPVPGGVGPMTVAMLMQATVEAWERKVMAVVREDIIQESTTDSMGK
jgi:hypothetical protein